MSQRYLFEADGLVKQYGSAASGRRGLHGASLTIPAAGRVALVGASGSGKTTLARCVAGHETPAGGRMRWHGETAWQGGAPWPPRRAIQLVYQDSPLAFNPRWSVSELLEEPLRLAKTPLAAPARGTRVKQWVERAGLDADVLPRTASEISGGQRQRLAVARALAVEELELLILDEPLSGLDAGAADALTALILDEQRSRGFALLYITHDLARVGELAATVAVIDAGVVVETAAVPRFFTAPVHAASRALIEAQL